MGADAPLSEGARTGFVYVLRSRSDKSEIQGLLKVGTTSRAVEDRKAHTETQAKFFFANVHIPVTFEMVGRSAKEAEQLHRTLRGYHVVMGVIGPVQPSGSKSRQKW